MSSHYKPESSRQWRGNSYRKGGERIRELRDEDSQATDREELMPCKIDPKDYTADQKKAVDDFHKLIADKIGVPCLVYDPPPVSCSHTECTEAHESSSKNPHSSEDCKADCLTRLEAAWKSGDSEEENKIISGFYCKE